MITTVITPTLSFIITLASKYISTKPKFYRLAFPNPVRGPQDTFLLLPEAGREPKHESSGGP